MNTNVFILTGPPNLLELLKDDIDLDLDNSIKTMKRCYRDPPTKNLYIVQYTSSKKNLEIYNKVKMDIMTFDPKAVVRGNQYMGKPTKGIGHYLFIHHCGKDECNDILNKMLNKEN